MSFDPGSGASVDDKNVFVPEETNRIELETEVVETSGGAPVLVAIYTMIDEDDGLGQMLKYALEQDPRVSFAAFRLPHRQEAVMTLRFQVGVQTNPRQVLETALDYTIRMIDDTASAFRNK